MARDEGKAGRGAASADRGEQADARPTPGPARTTIAAGPRAGPCPVRATCGRRRTRCSRKRSAAHRRLEALRPGRGGNARQEARAAGTGVRRAGLEGSPPRTTATRSNSSWSWSRRQKVGRHCAIRPRRSMPPASRASSSCKLSHLAYADCVRSVLLQNSITPGHAVGTANTFPSPMRPVRATRTIRSASSSPDRPRPRRRSRPSAGTPGCTRCRCSVPGSPSAGCTPSPRGRRSRCTPNSATACNTASARNGLTTTMNCFMLRFPPFKTTRPSPAAPAP